MFAHQLKRELLSIPGWSTARKTVVIESDDWGSVRMPSRSAFVRLAASGVNLTSGDSERYNRYDTLESADDMESLIAVLKKFRDFKGNYPVVTCFCLSANPDFDRIRKNHFDRYFYETSVETFERYYPNRRVFSYWYDGIAIGLFKPQFHGREHLNVSAWMNALRRRDHFAQLGFDEGYWGFNNVHPNGVSFLAAFDPENLLDLDKHREVICDGLALFEHQFGYRARVFVPPNGILHEDLYKVSMEGGIDFMYSSKLHAIPVSPGKVKRRFTFLGNRNNAGQIFLIRNAFFEPSQGRLDTVSKCLKEIETAFRWHKPAVISSHRVNYIGGLDRRNRERGLKQLSELLSAILVKWPDVEFQSSDRLGDMIKQSRLDR